MIKKFLGALCTFSLIIAAFLPVSAFASDLALKLSVASPRTNVSTTGSGFNIFGASDSSAELFVNGEPVQNRTEEGFFSIFTPLSIGENVFVFSQEGQADIVRIISREAQAAPAHPTMRYAAITNPFPSSAEYLSAGDILTFKATAPVGAVVSVEFAGESFALSPAHRFNNPIGSWLYSTTFSAQYEVGISHSNESIVDLGRPVYTMVFADESFIVSGAAIRLINDNAPFYATVTVPSAWVFPTPGLNGGPDWNLLEGQSAAVKAIRDNGNWVKLESGIWVQRENVSVALENEVISNPLAAGRYEKDGFRERIVFAASHYPAVNVRFDGSELRMYYALQSEHPSIDLSEINLDESFFSNIKSGVHTGIIYHSFEIRDSVNIEGYYISFENGEFSLNVRTRPTLVPGARPLSGFSFVIDAGHGGQDTGALGPMGTDLSEKDINLALASKLAEGISELGANVISVRTDDVFYTLQERTDVSRLHKPDMFISIHANSTAESTDATNIHGISFWYRNPNSAPLAQHFTDELHGINPLTTRNQRANRANFFVCRPVWTPSVIVEASFMNNIQDFAWMIRPDNQHALTKGLINSILSYYGNIAFDGNSSF